MYVLYECGGIHVSNMILDKEVLFLAPGKLFSQINVVLMITL